MPISLYLADTNILLRLVKRDHPQYPITRLAVESLAQNGMSPAFTLQNMAELWNVSTRPLERNGFGLTVETTESNAKEIEEGFTFLADSEAVYREWRRIATEYSISGVQVHDARLAVAMYVHGIASILTFNAPDFSRFKGIAAIDPSSLSMQNVSSESVL